MTDWSGFNISFSVTEIEITQAHTSIQSGEGTTTPKRAKDQSVKSIKHIIKIRGIRNKAGVQTLI